jgi:hypothetical protein
LREIIVTEQLTSIQQLLVDVKRTLQRQQPPPWAVYSQWVEQQKLLLRVKEVLGIYVDLLPRDVAVPEPAEPDVLPQVSQVSQVSQVRPIETDSAAQANADALAQVHDRTNQLINSLDSSLHLTFAALDRDVETYRLALTCKVEQLYELGERSESVVALLLQQVIDEAHEAALRPRLTPTSPALMSPPLTPAPAPLLLVDQSPPLVEGSIDRLTSLAELLPQLALAPPQLTTPPPQESINIEADQLDLSEFTLTGFDNLFRNE